jgi:hypothetical protein
VARRCEVDDVLGTGKVEEATFAEVRPASFLATGDGIAATEPRDHRLRVRRPARRRDDVIGREPRRECREPSIDRFVVRVETAYQIADSREHRRRDRTGVLRGLERRILEEAPALRLRRGDARERRPHLAGIRRAEADRVRETRRDADAVMREPGREVEHVAGTEHLVDLGRELLEDAEIEPRAEASVARLLRVIEPAALSLPLHEEDVVAVEVRADASAGRREADHDVVDADVRDEGERLEEE